VARGSSAALTWPRSNAALRRPPQGFRERLHGHNYVVRVALAGELSADGYVIDFGDVKEHTTKLCKQWNEHFICPLNSDVMTVAVGDKTVSLTCEDGARFQFPVGDCLLLPVVHSTAEELAVVFADRLIESLTPEYLALRKISTVQIAVGEHVGQEALYTMELATWTGRREIVAGRSPGFTGPCKGCLENVLHAHTSGAR
jgi:6-pyruvoyl-tetrahydropterin synthase